jgi:hypothetical protein
MTVAAQVRDGTAQPNNFDASVINSLFPTPLLDMRALNAHACNSSLSLADRVQALEVPPPPRPWQFPHRIPVRFR